MPKYTPPDSLTSRAQWVNWDAGTKRPRPKITGTLLTFEEACRRDERHVGYVFEEHDDPYAGIDIDEMTPLAHEMLSGARERGAFVQRSPSGEGWHVIGTGHLPRGIGKGSVDPGVEAYSRGRYFTMPTDVPWTGSPDVDIQDLLDQLTAERAAPTGIEPTVFSDPSQSFELEHAELLAHIDPDPYENWVAVGMAMKASGASAMLWDQWASRSEKYPGFEESARKWNSFKSQGRGLGTLYLLARAGGWDEGAAAVAEFEVEAPPVEQTKPEGGYWARLAIPPERVHVPAPAREWAWDQWIPYGVVTGLSGPPGVAKSTLAMQLCVHHCLGDAFLGAELGRGPAVFITVEDDEHELRRRLQNIAAGMFIDSTDVEGLTLVPAVNARTELVMVDRDGNLQATDRLKDLRRWLRGLGARLVVLDLVGDFWNGNENARAEVAGFVRSYLGRMAVQLGAAVLVVSHLNKQGLVSGSTAWLGSYRSAMVLDRVNGHLELIRTKANYAPPMDTPRRLAWDEGYVREVPMEVLDAEDEALAVQRIAAVPLDVWHGVDALRGFWGVTRAEVHPLAAEMVERGWLEQRQHARAVQWRRCEVG